MTWKELRSKIDKAVKESGKKADEIEIWYIDIDPGRAYYEDFVVTIGEKFHPGVSALWIDVEENGK